MKTIVYRITLLEPGLFTSLEGDPNSGVSFPFIPGSVLRGALIHKYRATHPLEPSSDDARRLFFNGETRFLNAYPVVNDARTEPTPKTWQHEKRNETNARDLAFYSAQKADSQGTSVETTDKSEPEPQWTEYRAPFRVEANVMYETLQPERQLTIHIQRPREEGRPKRGKGAIYRYEALAPQQIFEAEIQCQDADEKTLKELLGGEISLGGSRTGAYGRATIQASDKPAPMNTSNSSEDGKLRVILMSDALVRDKWGQFTSDPNAVGRAIAARLGNSVELKLVNAFMRTRYVGGFNRTWGLPLPQMMAIEMGSVFEFTMPSPKPDTTGLETFGIGERRAEGFGRVAIYTPVEHLKTKKWDPKESDEPQTADADDGAATQKKGNVQAITLDDDSSAVAQQMVERLMRKRLDENVIAVAYALEMDAEKLKPIRPAQLSRLRNLIHDELMFSGVDEPAKAGATAADGEPNADKQEAKEKPRERVQKYMKQVMARSTPKKQFTHARVDGMRLSDWIQALLELKPEHKRLSALFEVGGVPSLGKYTPHMTPELKDEYALKFLDAALRRALNVKREKEG